MSIVVAHERPNFLLASDKTEKSYQFKLAVSFQCCDIFNGFQQEQVACSPALEEAQFLRSMGAMPNILRLNSSLAHPLSFLL